MWKSASSISKVCGKGGKNSFIVFSMLSTDRHFHGLLGPPRLFHIFWPAAIVCGFLNPAHAQAPPLRRLSRANLVASDQLFPASIHLTFFQISLFTFVDL